MNDEIFEGIHRGLTVEHIMTPLDEFCFYPQDSALHKDITVFPIKDDDGKITRYFDSKSSKECYILPNKTVSKDLDLMSLIKMLDKRSFFFVVHADIVGIVTVADLRKGAVRMFFYLLLYRLENHMKMFFKERISEEEFIRIAKPKCRTQKKDYALSVFEECSFYDYLAGLKNYDVFKQKHGMSIRDVEEFGGLDRFRNWIMHPSREDVKVKIDSEIDYNHYLFKQLERIQRLEELLKLCD
ncbi:hypothetical protein [Methanolobus chelungpuianus]|uniref:CBS domain-containing protein n=1 Tax=Methanolobus chelungpuianus TaxID=502115 RepID=A0AAE3KYC5_9EURY|nr:hypothetical protein [Methanolobus chelungpuianus]MCQ6963651.1 hypothetical protein [Methanolobus chelungpuianus]